MKLEPWHPPEDKSLWKIVHTYNYADIPGEIISANEATGECTLSLNGETKTLYFRTGRD